MTLRRIDWVWITCLLLLAASLRIIGLSHGQLDPGYFPSTSSDELLHDQTPLHPDEFLFITRPLRMLVTGQLNPKFFENPSFLINANFLTFWLTDAGNGIDHEIRRDISGRSYAPFHLYLIGRTYSMLGGMLAVAATIGVGRLIAGRYAGYTAGLFVAVSFPLVQHAHYATTSSLAVGFTMLCIWACFASLCCKPARRWLFLAIGGISAGLAFGNRYNAGVVSVVVLLTGLILLYRHRSIGEFVKVVLAWLLFPLTFILTTPHVIFDTEKFLEDIRYITTQYLSGFEGVSTLVSPEVGLGMELQYLILFGIGIPVSIFVPIGIYYAINKWRSEKHLSGNLLQSNSLFLFTLLLLIYLVLYGFLILRTVRPNGADQLLIPVIPSFAMLAAIGVLWLHVRWLKTQPLFAWLVPIVVSFPMLLMSIQFTLERTQPDTRETALEWVYSNLAEQSQIYLYGPYNVPLDAGVFNYSQSFDEMLPADDLVAEGFDYAIVSDARYRNLKRFWQGNTNDIADELAQTEISYLEQGQLLFELDVPFSFGADSALHTASYWHNPGIRIYCLNQESCEAVG